MTTPAVLSRQFGVMQDITELWQAEQELRARQEMLDLAQKAARAVAFDWYIGARESENRWSPDLEAMYGLAPGTFDRTFQGWKKLVHPDDWPAVKLAIKHANESGDVAAEYRVIHKDGTVHWLQAKGRMFFDAEGRPERMVGFMIDVTDRRHAEEELRATEARFRTFVDHATDAFFLHADDSTVIDVNQQACVSLGYSREELIGMHPRQFDAGLDRPSLARIMERIGKGEPVTFETLHRRSDGTVFPVEVRVRQFLHGEKRLYASLVRDTSERKRAEEDLRASEARFRTFVDRATDAFFLLDDQSTVIDVNRQACEGLGYARDELIGMHPRDFDVALDEQSISRLAERAGAGETITFETRHRRRDGTVFPVEIRSGMFRQGDRCSTWRWRATSPSASSRRRGCGEQDHALQTARTELAHVSRLTTLGELTSSIAHEVSQPLGGMITSAGACARWLAAEPPDIAEARAALDNIAADGKRAREVIARIRALTKRQMVRKDSLDINHELLEVLALDGARVAQPRHRAADGARPDAAARAGRPGPAAAGAAQSDRECDRGHERRRRPPSPPDDRVAARQPERRPGRGARYRQRARSAAHRAGVRGVLHDQGGRHRHRLVDQPLHRRGPRRAAVGEPERASRRGLPVLAAGRRGGTP